MSNDLSKAILTRWPAIARTLASVAMLLSGSACTLLGTHDVAMDVDAELKLRNGPSDAWSPIAGENVKSRDPRSVAPFPSTTYRSKLLDWHIVVSPHSVGYSIRSNLPGALCIRFDEARMTSNLHDGALPLQVTYVEHGPAPTLRNTSGIAPELRPAFTPPPLCFPAGENTKFGFVLPVTKLFPSGRLFNVKWEGNSTILQNRGIGNWLRIRVPIEHDGKREELEITVILKDSAARLIYL
jgi:hypothetical protein